MWVKLRFLLFYINVCISIPITPTKYAIDAEHIVQGCQASLFSYKYANCLLCQALKNQNLNFSKSIHLFDKIITKVDLKSNNLYTNCNPDFQS